MCRDVLLRYRRDHRQGEMHNSPTERRLVGLRCEIGSEHCNTRSDSDTRVSGPGLRRRTEGTLLGIHGNSSISKLNLQLYNRHWTMDVNSYKAGPSSLMVTMHRWLRSRLAKAYVDLTSKHFTITRLFHCFDLNNMNKQAIWFPPIYSLKCSNLNIIHLTTFFSIRSFRLQ